MQVGMIGLGRMGGDMVRRLMKGGQDCVVFDLNIASVKALTRDGATGSQSAEEFITKLVKPRVIWLMVPAAIVDSMIDTIMPFLEPGDTVIDGGNSYYREMPARRHQLR